MARIITALKDMGRQVIAWCVIGSRETDRASSPASAMTASKACN
jgi:hypothetical protein